MKRTIQGGSHSPNLPTNRRRRRKTKRKRSITEAARKKTVVIKGKQRRRRSKPKTNLLRCPQKRRKNLKKEVPMAGHNPLVSQRRRKKAILAFFSPTAYQEITKRVSLASPNSHPLPRPSLRLKVNSSPKFPKKQGLTLSSCL